MELPASPAHQSAPTAGAATTPLPASSVPPGSPEALAPPARQDTLEPPATPVSVDITSIAEFAVFARLSAHFASSAALVLSARSAQPVMEEIHAVLVQADISMSVVHAEPANPLVLNALLAAAQHLAPHVPQDTPTLSAELA